MDLLVKEEIIEKAMILSELDSSKLSLVEIYFDNACDFILDYCKVSEIPTSLYSLISQMIVFQCRQKGIENISSEGKGSLSESYIVEYPPNIMYRLNPHCQVKFI